MQFHFILFYFCDDAGQVGYYYCFSTWNNNNTFMSFFMIEKNIEHVLVRLRDISFHF